MAHPALTRLRSELRAVAVFVALVWIVFFADNFVSLSQYGLRPREAIGLIGIISMTFLHASLQHLLSNTFPLLLLLSLLAISRQPVWQLVVSITMIGGSVFWIIGRSGNHIGASLLIFGLIAHIVSVGLYFQKRLWLLLIALLVGFLYGTAVLRGILPLGQGSSKVSWDGHLCGVLAGVATAYLYTRDFKARTNIEK